jgi:type 1 glutamine amidotransferase
MAILKPLTASHSIHELQTHCMKLRSLFLGALLTAGAAFAAEPVKPLRVLIVAGGCCHDYIHQPVILKDAIEGKLNATVEIALCPDAETKTKTTAKFPIYDDPNWAKNFDVVIHDECSSDIMDHPYVDNIVNAHKIGVPGVNLHCAMHCYRKGFKVTEPVAAGQPDAIWFDYLGLQSCRHGKQLPIAIAFVDTTHPITKGLENWTTINEELYNNVQGDNNFKTWPEAHALARGKQAPGDVIGTNDTVVAWTNLYGPNKTRVFSTTIGHNTDTVKDPRYLDLVTRGVLWVTGKLGDDSKPVAGYGK